MTKTEVLIIGNNYYLTLLNTIINYVCLFGGFGINYYFLGASTILDLLLSFLLLIVVFNRVGKHIKRLSEKEALEYLAMRLGKVVS